MMNPRLRPMSEAPKTAVEIAIAIRDRHGNKRWVTAHHAEGGGEDQPRFGPGRFTWTGYAYVQLEAGAFLGWIPLPDIEIGG